MLLNIYTKKYVYVCELFFDKDERITNFYNLIFINKTKNEIIHNLSGKSIFSKPILCNSLLKVYKSTLSQ